MTAETGREAGVIPPIPASLPAWSTWIDGIRARMGAAQWPCPLEGCHAVMPSASFAADHLEGYHGWDQLDIQNWWGK